MYGTRNLNATVSVGVASTLVVTENPSRRRITFVNDSLNTIYLSKGGGAVINTGIRLNASGGAYSDDMDNFGYIYRGEYAAIATGAASALTICEEPGIVRS